MGNYVKALFINVTLNETLKIIKSKYEENNYPLDEINLIEICFTSSHFSFKDIFYEQKDGKSMGSPLYPMIANILWHGSRKSYNINFT